MKLDWSTRLRFWVGYWLPSMVIGLFARLVVRRERVNEPDRLLVLLPERLGDVVFTTPLLRALHRRFPNATLVVAAPAVAADMLTTCPWVSRIDLWRPGLLAAVLLGLQLRRAAVPDWVIIPRADPDQSWAGVVAVLTGASRRLGLTDGTTDWSRIKRLQAAPFLTDWIRPPDEIRHERLRRLHLIHLVGGDSSDSRMEAWARTSDRRRVDAFLANLPRPGLRLALGIGAGSAHRQWPIKRFAALIDALAEELPIVPIVIASRGERGLVKALAASAQATVYSLEDATVRESVALLEGCAVYVGNDSGPAHLAAAVGLPIVVVSALPVSVHLPHPENPEKCAPACACVHVLRPLAPAGPACNSGCVAAAAHCILGVETTVVLETVRFLIAAQRNAAGQKGLQ